MNIFRKFIRNHPKFATALSTLGPIGTKLPAPGTMGSIAGLPFYWFLFSYLDSFSFIYFSLVIISTYFAVVISSEAEYRFKAKDPGYIIIDEFIAIPICFIGFNIHAINYHPWILLTAGFLFFRFFDIFKPLGIKSTQSMKKGWGVVIDDVCAAALTNITLHIIIGVIHHYHATHLLRSWMPFLFKAS